MKKKNTHCKYLVLFFLCFACTPKKTETIKNDNFYVVDLDSLGDLKTTRVNASSIFKSLKTIILETNKDCLVGPHFKFSAFDHYLFILNTQYSKDFLVFDREGRFIRKIGGLGKGPGEYARVFDFTLDTANHIIYLLCDRIINKYQMDGIHIGAIRLDRQAFQIQYAYGKLYTEVNGGKYMLQEIDPETGKQTGLYLETAQYNKGWNEPDYTFGDRPLKRCWVDFPKFSHTFMDTIIAIRQDGMAPFLAIKSKHLARNADVEATIGKTPEDRINAIKNKDKIFCINNYFDTKKHIFFRYYHGDQIFPVLYDRLTNSCQKAFIFNDFAFVESEKMISFNIISSDDDGIYEGISDYNRILFLEEFIEKGKLTSHVDKRDELMKLNEDSNPVIFYYSYDDDAE